MGFQRNFFEYIYKTQTLNCREFVLLPGKKRNFYILGIQPSFSYGNSTKLDCETIVPHTSEATITFAVLKYQPSKYFFEKVTSHFWSWPLDFDVEVYVYADDVIQFHQPLIMRCLRWHRHNHHHCVCVQSKWEQLCVLPWSASCIVELWVNCRWRHQHKHTLPHRDLKVKIVLKLVCNSYSSVQL